MEVLVVGLNHQTAMVDLRERVAFTPAECREAADQLRAQGILEEVVILSTCNRSEVYGVPCQPGADSIAVVERFMASFHRVPLERLETALYRHRGRDAIMHLFRVTSGLDSLLLGEAEVLGQVRKAYQNAFEGRSTGRVLNRLFQSALEVGKRVRTETEIGVCPVSVAFAGVKLAEQIFGGLHQHRCLILGAGATSEKVIRHLRERGEWQLRVLNRTAEKARDLVARYGGEVVPWENLVESVNWPDLIVTSLSHREPVLTRQILEQAMQARGNRSLFVIDLGVPRNVAADAAELYNVYLYDIDGLTEIVERNKNARKGEIPKVEAIIDGQISKFMHWRAGVAASNVIAELSAKPSDQVSVLLRKHMASLPDLSDDDRAHLTTLVDRYCSSVPHDSREFLQNLPKLLRKIYEPDRFRSLPHLDQQKI